MADTPNAPAYAVFNTGTRSKKYTWAMSGVSTGVPIPMSDWSDRTMQIFGTWGSATLVWQGSNDDRADPSHASYASSVWVTLTDTTETALSFTANDGAQILQKYQWCRPITTGGTSTAVTATLNVGKQ